MNKSLLRSTANKMVAEKRGILAADESSGTIAKRFDSINVKSTPESNRRYRGLLFTTPGMEKFISGVIMFDETVRQKGDSGVSFPKLLSRKGVVPGIKVDKGAHPMAGFDGEKITEGLDGLRERLEEYFAMGLRFSKWRAVITIGKGIPTQENIDANAHALARYAALSQEARIVPIVEPEVLMDGDHTISRCESVTKRTLKSVFTELEKYKIYLPGMILKPNMIVSGKDCKSQASVAEVARRTVNTFKQVVPSQVPGVVFLSGGLSPDEATERLDGMNKLGKFPWELSFSFGRALQQGALKAWKGKMANARATQEAFYRRAQLVSAGRDGRLEMV